MKKSTAIILAVAAIIVIATVVAFNIYIHQRRAEQLNQYENDNIKLRERVDAGDRQIENLKADTTELKKIIRVKIGEQQARDREVDQLRKREKKYLNESNSVLRYSDNRMDSIYRARYPTPDSLRRIGPTAN